jgi:NAD(P)-dependent dehydrogenase (short-subunit alcohol dehydrogenase family)
VVTRPTERFDLGLDGKVVVVAGASRGIGAAVAERLASRGADVCLVARDQDRLDAVAERCRTHGGTAHGLAADLHDPAAPARVVDEAVARLGRIDVVVNCVATGHFGPPLEVTVEHYERALSDKFLLYVALNRAVIPRLVAQGSGVIVNVAGVGGVRPFPTSIPNGAANAAIVLYTKAMGRELAGSGVRMVAFSPGATRTELYDEIVAARAARDGVDHDEAARRLVDHIPIGRPAEIDEVADAIAFLSSARAAYFAASHVVMDGGQIETT